jgi:hypothetical protein
MEILTVIKNLILVDNPNEIIYRNNFDEEATDNITTLYFYNTGAGTDITLNGSLNTQINNIKIQIRVRDLSYDSAYNRILNILNSVLYKSYSDSTINVIAITQISNIFSLGLDGKDRSELTVNIEAKVKFIM